MTMNTKTIHLDTPVGRFFVKCREGDDRLVEYWGPSPFQNPVRVSDFYPESGIDELLARCIAEIKDLTGNQPQMA